MKIIHGNCIEEMKLMDKNSIDSIVSDPPYGISFMGKKWDKFTPKSFQEFSEQWGIEALRVLKPGGYCLAFSGTRTYHRMTVGLEDAGFVIKDMIAWMYGSGFPKSLDISKAIDKHLGKEREKGQEIIYPDGGLASKRKVIGNKHHTDIVFGESLVNEDLLYESIPNSNEAQLWSGFGTALKPSFEPVIVAQKPIEGTYAQNVLNYGVGGLNIDGCRITTIKENEPRKKWEEPSGQFIGYGNKEKSNTQTVDYGVGIRNKSIGEYADKGRFPANMLLTHHPECQLVGIKQVKTSTLLKKHNIDNEEINERFSIKAENSRKDYGKNGYDKVDAYQCHPSCPIQILDEQSGELGSSGRPNLMGKSHHTKGVNTNFAGGAMNIQHMDKGGASRFFYCGKAHKSERNAGLLDLEHTNNTEMVNRKENSPGIENPRAGAGRGQGAKNDIVTLKPINVMRYLVRLVTPPKGTVLDPFAGSGTTGIACIIEGFDYILIEKRERFANLIIPKRLKYWKDSKNWNILKDHNILPKIKRLKNEKQNISLESWLKPRKKKLFKELTNLIQYISEARIGQLEPNYKDVEL